MLREQLRGGISISTAEFDLHGYYSRDIYGGLLTRIVQQALEMGASELVLIHGRSRGISPGFVNTNRLSPIDGPPHAEKHPRTAAVDLPLDDQPG
jgi:hypothetical protein